MTSVQGAVAMVLDDVLLAEGYVVKPFPWAPDAAEPGKKYIAVYRTGVEPAPNARGARRHDLNIVVMVGQQDPAAADDALDVALERVLEVVETDEQLKGLVWTRAERGVVDDTYPAMTIETWCGSTTEYGEQP